MFHHLHVHTEYSLLDGMCKLDDYISLAKKQGQNAVTITDHGNINGAIHFIEKCEKQNIKPIIGNEFYIVDDRRSKEKKRMHIVALAKNKIGYQNLCRLTSISNLEGFYFRPRIDFEILEKYKEGLIILSGCLAGPLNQSYLKNNSNNITKYFDFFTKNFKDDFYLEIMPIDMEEQRKVNLFMEQIANKQKINIVATNDVHYLLPKDNQFQDMLLCIGSKRKMVDKTRFRFSIDSLFLADETDMQEMFEKNHPNLSKKTVLRALKETENIVNKCEKINLRNLNLFPKTDFLKGKYKTTEESFLNLIKNAMEHKRFDKKEKYIKRCNEEIKQIIQKGFIDYFLLVWDIVRFAQQQNILVGPGRGSSAGSLVCFLLGITNIDPIKHKTLFFRFIDPNRNDLPDIDIDFEDTRRHEIKEYLVKRYGTESISHVGTFGKLKGKLVLKDLCRIFDVPLNEAEKITAYVDDVLELKDIFRRFDECKSFAEKYPLIVEAGTALEGQVKQTGINAAGMIAIDGKISDYCPLELRGPNKEICLGYDKQNLEYLGLLKIDLLGINFLTVIQETLKKLEKKDIRINIQGILPEDFKVFESMQSRSCIGIFQFEAPITQKISKEIGIDNFTEMVACNALTRPGPARSGSLSCYIQKKHDKKEIKYLTPEMENITKKTRGEILYQEQVMMICRKIGGFSWGDTNLIRKAISKKEESDKIEKYQKRFIKGAKKRGMSQRQAISIWDTISLHAAYSFNKSHSVAYSLLSYWCAWLKYYHFKEYMECFINYNSNQIRISEGIKEFKKLGYKFRFCQAKNPITRIFLTKNKRLIIGLNFIKGLGPAIIDELMKFKKCKTLDKWVKNINKRVINTRIKKILVNIGYFKCWKTTTELNDFFNFEKENKAEWISEHCPLYFCDNLLEPYSDFLKDKFTEKLEWEFVENIKEENKGNSIILKGVMEKITLKSTESWLHNTNTNYQQYCVANINDGTGVIRLTFYPQLFKKYQEILSENNEDTPVIVRGVIAGNEISSVTVKEFINIKSWKNKNVADYAFAIRLKNGIRNQMEVEKVKKDIAENINRNFQVEIAINKEHQAKNGLMAFGTAVFYGDVEIGIVIWADAYQRWRTALNSGRLLSVRFSKFDQGKLYIDTRYSQVEEEILF